MIDQNTPTEILWCLTDNHDRDVRAEIVRHPNVTLEIILKLAKDTFPDVRMAVASSPLTPGRILTKLSRERNYAGILYDVARNPHTPVRTLLKLAAGGWSHVVAKNPSCPPAAKMWLQSGGFCGMTLYEFVKATKETP